MKPPNPSSPSRPAVPDWLNLIDASPVQIVPQILEQAVLLKASDLFFASDANCVTVQIRRFGVVQPLTLLPAELGRRAIAHIKTMSNLEVAEKRRPLDGRWLFTSEKGQVIDLRVNTIPTLHGEDITLRLLERESQLLALDKLGFLRADLNRLLALLNTPSGLIVVTGPTGAGKTTTLYSCLAYLNNGQRKINTIEDPIEYAIAGIRQSQVNPKLDVGFAELLRSILRQAPDVIMIGEVRDEETATTAVRAANSGHLVFATLHAPMAAGAVQSLLSLNVHPHFLASSLLGVVAQRLVRTLCPKCKRAFELDDTLETFDEVRPWLEPGQGKQIFGPGNCEECLQSGYAGRAGVFEVLAMNRPLRHLVAERQPTSVIRQEAIKAGMIEFRKAALLKVAQGTTSIEEVFRVIPPEYLTEDL